MPIRIKEITPLPSPQQLRDELPLTHEDASLIASHRRILGDLIQGRDPRLLVVVGPCSIHDPKSAKEYAHRLLELRSQVGDELFIVMRAYFEKPRTHRGWKGFITDPDLDQSYQVNKGLKTARALLLELTQWGLPLATEFLDPLLPQYLEDLISWGAIGARNAQSQPHRCLASGLSMPIGFKNNTQGLLDPALHGMQIAQAPQRFFGIGETGQPSVFHTTGNPDVHLVLRGGHLGPNCSPTHLAQARQALQEHELPQRILIDCGHGNSQKQAQAQPQVLASVLEHAPREGLLGFMIESHLHGGSQDPSERPLRPGVSVTDPCLDWAATRACLLRLVPEVKLT